MKKKSTVSRKSESTARDVKRARRRRTGVSTSSMYMTARSPWPEAATSNPKRKLGFDVEFLIFDFGFLVEDPDPAPASSNSEKWSFRKEWILDSRAGWVL